LYDQKPEPFNGTYPLLLLNTQEQPSLSAYKETKTFRGERRAENGSWISYNTTIQVQTTPIRAVVTSGDRIAFNISIIADDDLLFEEWSLHGANDGVEKFRIEKGKSNDVFVVANLTQGDTFYRTYLKCQIEVEEDVFNYTRRLSFGYFLIWDIDIYKNVDGEDCFIGSMGYSLLLLPYSCCIVSNQEAIVENGKMDISFPLNESLQADRIAFVKSGYAATYILEINAAAIYLSPPFTLLPAILLIISYAAFKKRRELLLHLAKYRVFYTCVLFAVTWVSTASIRAAFLEDLLRTTPSYIVGTVDIFLFVCVSFIGAISIGVARNDFEGTERRDFWRTSIQAMTFLALIFVARWGYLVVTSGEYPDGLSLVFIALLNIEVPVVLFLGACMVGMIGNFLMSYASGLSLFFIHLCLRSWNRIQNKHETAPIKVDSYVKTENIKPFRFYTFELFLSSVWFLILLSSSISVNIDRLWETLFESSLIFLIIPLATLVYLFFVFGTLNTTWHNGKEPTKLDSTVFRKIWSLFALLVFITKIVYSSADPEFLTSILTLFYFLLIVSSGFAAGFVGTRNIAVRRAIKEIFRIGKRYTWLQIG
jgi:hypothetical protein